MRTAALFLSSSLCILLSMSACGDKDDTGDDGATDGGSSDGGSTDGGSSDGGSSDGGSSDGGSSDGGSDDGGSSDGGSDDGGSSDGGSSDGGSDDGGSDDGGSSDGGSDDGGAEEATATVTLTDYPSGSPIVGATVTLGDDTYTTDAEGRVSLMVPTWSAYQYTATADGYLNMTSFGYNDGEGFTSGQNMVMRSVAETVYGATGLTYDTAKGTTVAAVFDFSGKTSAFLPGASVDLGASAALTLVADSSSGLGFSAGSTTLDGSSAWVLFLNHDVGSATPTITPPEGYVCTIFPGEESSVSFDLQADTLNIVTFACTTE